MLNDKDIHCCGRHTFKKPEVFYSHLQSVTSDKNCPYHYFLQCMIESLYEPNIYLPNRRKNKDDREYFDQLKIQEVRNDYCFLSHFKIFSINR